MISEMELNNIIVQLLIENAQDIFKHWQNKKHYIEIYKSWVEILFLMLAILINFTIYLIISQ